jgi:hypothetical protein
VRVERCGDGHGIVSGRTCASTDAKIDNDVLDHDGISSVGGDRSITYAMFRAGDV